MNVESSSSAAVSSSSTDTRTQAAQTQKTSDKSFEEELKAAQKPEDTKKEQKAEKNAKAEKAAEKENEAAKKDNVKTTEEKNADMIDPNSNQSLSLFGSAVMTNFDNDNGFTVDNRLSLKDNVQAFLKNSNLLHLQNFQFKGIDSSMTAQKASLDYKNIKMDDNDAKFFADLVQNTDMSMQSVASEIQKSAEMNVEKAQKSANVSAALMDALKDAVKTNQPIRIDFDKNVSVIIKVDKDGSITANFIPGDKAVEQYLKENMGFLRQRFDEQNLPYSDINYSRHKEQQENQRRNNKENNNE